MAAFVACRRLIVSARGMLVHGADRRRILLSLTAIVP